MELVQILLVLQRKRVSRQIDVLRSRFTALRGNRLNMTRGSKIWRIIDGAGSWFVLALIGTLIMA